MDKKSFFRGFGVGVLFASIILGISFMIRTSDSFVKSRARELGMVYAEKDGSDKVISDTSEEISSEQEANSDKIEESKTENQENAKEVADSQNNETESKDSEEKNSQDKETSSEQKKIDMEKEKLEKNMNEERAKLTINAGEWSSDVSKKLEKMKIIDNADDFDAYLEKNGYGNSITAGTYTVSPEDTYKQIAQKITGKSK